MAMDVLCARQQAVGSTLRARRRAAGSDCHFLYVLNFQNDTWGRR